jgi:homoserine dehydrogenase
MVSIAIMGHGVVGSGVAEILLTHKQKLFARLGEEIYIKKVLDLREFPDSPIADRFTKDFEEIINDLEIRVVVEVMGGLHPSYEFVSRCIKAGKSVVTSNKELIAEKGCELLKAAQEHNVNFLFEASVGGGIPIIRPITQCLAANDINEIAGILNGTTNFILTMMIKEGMDFDEALRLAQRNGYAERDPSADIEGHDACRKIAILAALCFGKHVYPADIETEGITKITLADVDYAANWGGVIKLIARAKKLENGKITAIVSPAFVEYGSQLAGVDDVFNAILVRGDAIGDVVFYGRGAGKLPTASAVVADVIDCAVHIKERKDFGWGEGEENYVQSYLDTENALYVRFTSDNKEKALSDAQEIFGGVKVLERKDAPANEGAFATPVAKEGDLREKLAKIDGITVESVIRITDY